MLELDRNERFAIDSAKKLHERARAIQAGELKFPGTGHRDMNQAEYQRFIEELDALITATRMLMGRFKGQA